MQWSNKLAGLWWKAQETYSHTALEAYAHNLEAMLARKPDEYLQSLHDAALRMGVIIQERNTAQIVEDEPKNPIIEAFSYFARR